MPLMIWSSQDEPIAKRGQQLTQMLRHSRPVMLENFMGIQFCFEQRVFSRKVFMSMGVQRTYSGAEYYGKGKRKAAMQSAQTIKQTAK